MRPCAVLGWCVCVYLVSEALLGLRTFKLVTVVRVYRNVALTAILMVRAITFLQLLFLDLITIIHARLNLMTLI